MGDVWMGEVVDWDVMLLLLVIFYGDGLDGVAKS
jgi:hypothetical protein